MRSAIRLLVIAALASPPVLHAESADRDKPLRIEADAMRVDDARRVTVFEGNVAVYKGTLQLRADRVVITQGPDGLQHVTATGKPARFRQRTDPKGSDPAVWIDGQAQRIEFNHREEKVELHDGAHVCRGGDLMRGEIVVYDQRTEFLSARGDPGSGREGRVQMVIQPRTEGASPEISSAGACPPP